MGCISHLSPSNQVPIIWFFTTSEAPPVLLGFYIPGLGSQKDWSMDIFHTFTLWLCHIYIYVKIAIENGPVEIASCLIKNMVTFHSYVNVYQRVSHLMRCALVHGFPNPTQKFITKHQYIAVTNQPMAISGTEIGGTYHVRPIKRPT